MRAHRKRSEIVQQVIGVRFGRLQVIGVSERTEANGRKRPVCRCRCDCGKIKDVLEDSLSRQRTQSCGCLMIERTVLSRRTHGHSCVAGKRGTRVYEIWKSMFGRCTNPNNKSFVNYGGRGITVCQRWLDSFEAFLADMGEPPPGTSIDRIDNNGPYSPENCRWAEKIVQARNTRSNRILTLGGRSQCLAAWADELGMNRRLISNRLRLGWSDEAALTIPVQQQRKSVTRVPVPA